MKRCISVALSVLLACAGIMLLAGCHGTKGPQEVFAVPESFDSDKHYEITFWAKNDTNLVQAGIYKKAIASFMELYPNITVNLRLYIDYGKIYNDVITNIATDTTPNVCISYPDHIATYLTGTNVVVPLDALFTDERFGFGGSELRYDGPDSDEMIDKFLNECAINGTHYAVPYMRSTEALYINVSMLEKLGYTLPDEITWDFIWEASDAAAKKDANGTYLVNGQKTMIPFIYKSTDNMMIQMLRQKKADYSTSNGDVLLFNDDTKELLFTIADHVKNGSFSTFKISSYPGNFLNAGQCLFAVDSTAGATWMGKAAPHADISEDAKVDYKIAVRPIPQFDPASPQMISQGPSVCIFNKEDPGEVLASWLFMQYLLTNEVQIAYAQTEGYIPVTKKAQESAEYKDYLSRAGEDQDLYYDVKIEASKLLLNNINNTFVTPVFNGSASLRDAAGQLIENVAKSIMRKETVNGAYIEKMFRDVQSLYRLDQIQTNASSGGANDLGPLPKASVILLSSLAGIWILMGILSLAKTIGKKRKQNCNNS